MISLLLLTLTGMLIRHSAAPREAAIFTIQGRAHLSPLLGQRVRTSGVITASGDGRVYLQGPADNDPATSDAVIARTNTAGLVRRDEVRVTGIVSEVVPGGATTANLSVTTIEAEVAEVLRRDAPLPQPVVLGRAGRVPPARVISADELPVNLRMREEVQRNRFDPEHDAIDFFESLEGMLVTVPRAVAVSATQTFSKDQSEIVTLADAGLAVSSGRRTRIGGLRLQPAARDGGNPERIQIQFDRALYPGNVPLVRVGDTLGDVTGVIRYSFGNYEVAAVEPLTVTRGDLQPERSTLPHGSNHLVVASYNVLNLSPTAADSAQLRLLAGQIVESLHSPDVLAVQEIQDNSGEADDGTTRADRTLAALSDAIVAGGGPRYASVDVPPADGRPGGVPGGNIRNAFLYNPGRVRLLQHRALTPPVLASAGARDTLAFQEARDPLEGVFQFRGRPLRIINNHLTSRFGSTPIFGSIQPFVQAGEVKRAAQVRALHAYSRHVLSADPDARLIVLGDMNTFEFSPELAELLPGSPPILFPLLPGIPEDHRYTYNFEGTSQTLDHAFVSGALQGRAELDIVHLNVDFPALPGVTASDHEPIVIRCRW